MSPRRHPGHEPGTRETTRQEPSMIIQMAGLPATGKSTLADHLSRELNALVLDKDRIRHALFGPGHITYTRDQDDTCVTMMLQAAQFALTTALCTTVIMDGRTCLRRYQVDQIRQFATQAGQALTFIECVCATTTARRRLDRDHEHGTHLAANRDYTLYRHLRATAEPIPDPKLRICTDEPLADCLAQCRDHLSGLLTPAR
ncbi:AAA family ATPase [Streptosporangium sp. G11]|uniref:AAA family ATPase n=1 Tax=Streptosporangium sp. G11 TaxID=3436926 RepID=UPI003EBC1480